MVGDSLNLTEHEIDDKGLVCEPVCMGNRVSDTLAERPGDSLNPAKSITKQPASMACGPIEDGTKMSPCCDIETLESSLGSVGSIGGQTHVDGCGDCVQREEKCSRDLASDNGAHGGTLSPRKEESHTPRLEENFSTQVGCDLTTKGSLSEDSTNNKDASVSVGDLPNKTVRTSNVVIGCASSERVANNSFEQASTSLGQGNDASIQNEQSEQKEKSVSLGVDDTKREQKTQSNFNVIQTCHMDGAQRSLIEEVKISIHDMSKNSGRIEQDNSVAFDAKDCPMEKSEPQLEGMSEKGRVVVLGSPAISAGVKSRVGQKRGKASAVLMERQYPLRSSVNSTGFLSSGSRESHEAPQPVSNLENSRSRTKRKKGRTKKIEMKGQSDGEYSRMIKHLRYLLHRIKYAQNLLDAYSNEGWRSQSIEKLRPENELQRARADISCSKLKIRNLFQHLDSLSAEGNFSESLFDSEGLIDSEDIFCAKCASKDVTPDNDIILCDGACDRGFHQFCLKPPLRTEEIPPGDEGWLCPACDCKVDCAELLNASQGTELSIEDSWEKVFPEAVAATVNIEHDDIMALPSDDSEDNDYNPDVTDDYANVEESESSSDKSDSAESGSSDCSSVSDDLGTICSYEQYLGLPSDDSEDDDYDPDAADVDEDAENESSSSDFTSASEDLEAAVDNDGTLGDELQQPLGEPNQDMGDSPLVSGRRHLERLDYEKLYDETYGNAPSDSCDDEEWDAIRKKKGRAKKGTSASSNGNASVFAACTSNVGSPQKRGKKLNKQAANASPAQLTNSSPKTCSSGKMKKTPYKKLGEAATQRLCESFKENQYPDRKTKEKLATELGITHVKVAKWFENVRWSSKHHPAKVEASQVADASHSNTQHDLACNGTESASADIGVAAKGDTPNSSIVDRKESDRSKPTPNISRKRKKTAEDQPKLQSSNTEVAIEGSQNETLQASENQHGGVQTRRRKSGAS